MSREVIIRISDREYKDYYANDPSTKEVIRCVDCMSFVSGRCLVWDSGVIVPDDYCSFGERCKHE